MRSSKVKSGREAASETVCFRVCFLTAFHMEFMLTPRARKHARSYNIRASERQAAARFESVQVTSHHIASHRIVSYRHNPWDHRRVTPLFCRLHCLHIRLLEGENPSNSVPLFIWSPVGSPFSSASTLWRFSKSAVQFGLSALSGSRLLGTSSALIAACSSWIFISRSKMNACCQWSADTLCICVYHLSWVRLRFRPTKMHEIR